jgi:membrane protein implicated in regulation of membrane protease activity
LKYITVCLFYAIICVYKTKGVVVLEFFTQYITWWHWIIVGILFIILEMATGTFIVLGFGIAAVLVGLIDLLLDINFLVQVILWIFLAIFVIGISFKYFKEQPIVSSSGQSNHGFDTLGTVTKTTAPHTRGSVRFDTPVLGNTIWSATAKQKLEVGTRVTIQDVKGQLISVVPTPTSKQTN